MASQLALHERFVAVGVSADRARVFVEALTETANRSRDDLATKDFLRAEMQTLRTEMVWQKSSLRWQIWASQAAVVGVLVALSNFTQLL